MLLNGLIMIGSSQIKEERSINSIYHLITGKRSIQTVQDAHIYGLDKYYGIVKNLSKIDFDRKVQLLVKQQLLTIPSTSTSTCRPTTQGLKWLDEKQNHLPFTYFNGLTYHGIDTIFLERLILLIQVFTNSKMKHVSYIPVIDRPSIMRWVKSFYITTKTKLHADLLKQVYHELYLLLKNFSNNEAEMFVDRLSGHQHYGMSIQQLADRYDLSVDTVQILLIGITHRMLDIIRRDIDQFPFIGKIIDDLHISGFITQSAQITYKLIKEGNSIEQIAKKRNLKINTIYDHIVEIALHDSNFPIHTYVSNEQQYEILEAAQQTNTSKLKKIKDIVSDDISYFQIRLALTSIHK